MVPEKLLESLSGVKGFDRIAFEQVHAEKEKITSIRTNPWKKAEIKIPHEKIPWCGSGYYLAERPSFTFDPLFHAGCYYVQEASSMFLECALKQTVDLSQSLRVLDLCGAPGGKSTHLLSLLNNNSLLVSNEVIRSRAEVLKDNINKWGRGNVVVTNNDPRDFSRLENFFDVIVIDAPCSGSGLFRRDEDAIGEWSEQHVMLCRGRQQRIISDVWPALKKDGILIYSTCSYSKEEDEDILDWLQEEWRAEIYPLKTDPDWSIVESGGGYRFWPDKIKGEGFFIACLRKTGGGVDTNIMIPVKKAPVVSRMEEKILENWVDTEGLVMVKPGEKVFAWPTELAPDMVGLMQKLRFINSGTILGVMMRDKLVPDHALALSLIKNESLNKIELNYDQAIAYLRKRELQLVAGKGWQLVTFKGHALGWVNVLSNRINNYYPKELRILK